MHTDDDSGLGSPDAARELAQKFLEQLEADDIDPRLALVSFATTTAVLAAGVIVNSEGYGEHGYVDQRIGEFLTIVDRTIRHAIEVADEQLSVGQTDSEGVQIFKELRASATGTENLPPV